MLATRRGEHPMMQPPIIYDDRGDVLIFDSPDWAESYLEPFVVRQSGPYGYDGIGHLLRFDIRVVRGRERVQVALAEPEPTHVSDLREILIRFLTKLGVVTRPDENLGLDELIARAERFAIAKPKQSEIVPRFIADTWAAVRERFQSR